MAVVTAIVGLSTDTGVENQKKILTIASGVLTCSGTTADAAFVSSLPETKGGTNQTTYAQGDILYASASNTLSKLAKDTNTTRYLSNTGTSNNPAWAQVALSTGVSDYATGTWTPTLSFGGGSVGITYAANSGTYTRVGSMVTCWGRIFLSNKGSSTGGALISGLPFNDVTTTTAVGTVEIRTALGLAAGYGTVVLTTVFNTATMLPMAIGGNIAETNLTNANFTNTTDLFFNISYRVT